MLISLTSIYKAIVTVSLKMNSKIYFPFIGEQLESSSVPQEPSNMMTSADANGFLTSQLDMSE